MEDLEAFTEDVAKANNSTEMADCCERILSLTQVISFLETTTIYFKIFNVFISTGAFMTTELFCPKKHDFFSFKFAC